MCVPGRALLVPMNQTHSAERLQTKRAEQREQAVSVLKPLDGRPELPAVYHVDHDCHVLQPHPREHIRHGLLVEEVFYQNRDDVIGAVRFLTRDTVEVHIHHRCSWCGGD